jgi:hypothetical protein
VLGSRGDGGGRCGEFAEEAPVDGADLGCWLGHFGIRLRGLDLGLGGVKVDRGGAAANLEKLWTETSGSLGQRCISCRDFLPTYTDLTFDVVDSTTNKLCLQALHSTTFLSQCR